MINKNISEKLFVALDFSNLDDTLALVDELGEDVNCYKVGMQLFYAAGNSILKELKKRNKKIFLDLKLHDIPNTVAEGLKSLLLHKADILTIHTIGGSKMMTESVNQIRKFASQLGINSPKIVGITILTSIDENQYTELGYQGEIKDQVIKLAKLAKNSGLDGVVSSPLEAEQIRKICGDDFIIITPGIRPQNANIDDQSRVSTPKIALKNGASHLVVGRPITKSNNPSKSALEILNEME